MVDLFPYALNYDILSTLCNQASNITRTELQQELRRRGCIPEGTIDELSEGLQEDDESRGSCATTVTTEDVGYYIPQSLNLPRPAEFEQLALVGSLINQRIIYWTLGTFSPSLQLFFESGLSCMIDAGRATDAMVGLDEDLRLQLENYTHEENGRIIKTPMPKKFEYAAKGLVIREAVIARRTSAAIKFHHPSDPLHVPSSISNSALASIVHEQHTVVGLRVDGMSRMAYVWAKVGSLSKGRDATWAGVGISGIRNDIPVPFLGHPGECMRPGSEATLVVKESLISIDVLTNARERASS
ncbi:hypothetical protein IAQ61_004056 [Plenodomus lingam]|uniref:uncharacterized protein n=1 Tax=Leptosphaeria maculans TaxID=5022 RepID=UPI00331CAF02|nr:hypothetical protein IAQ61_004056 [Plenodomus lingam]